MKSTIFVVAILSVTMIAFDCAAQPTAAQGKGGGKGKVGLKSRGKEKGKRPGQGGERDMGLIVARMMKEFDKDGDRKLNTVELTALLKKLQERRGQMGQGRPGQRPGDFDKGKGKGKGRSKGNDAPATGGQKPKRPASDG